MVQNEGHGWFLWLLDQTRETVIGTTAVVILCTRSPGTIYFSACAVATTKAAKILKKVFRQPRPAETTTKITYGMPSSHSAAIAYYATYISLASLYLPLQHPFKSFPHPWPMAIAIPWSLTVVLSRIWLGHHTLPQVVAGSALGAICGCIAFRGWISGAEELTNSVLYRMLPTSLLPS